MAGLRKRLTAQRARKRDADRKSKRFADLIRTQVAFLAQRPRLAAFLARKFNLRFTSGWRSKQHNENVGGVPGSWHTKGSPASPGAVDLVGSDSDMLAAMLWARAFVPNLAESLIHDAGSGVHLHLGGTGVINWRHPSGGRIKRWRAAATRQRKRSRDAQKRIDNLKDSIEKAKQRGRREAIARKHGAKFVDIIFDNCERLELPGALGLAVIEKESLFRNCWGGDAAPNGGTTGLRFHTVTEERYRAYKRLRGPAGKGGRQGVGPAQLTWHTIQDEADRRGGCWKPEHNIAVGLENLKANIDKHGEAEGIARYNGTGPAAVAYSRDVRAKRDVWRKRLDAA